MSLPRAIVLYPNDGCLTVARALHRRGVEVYALAVQDSKHMLTSRAWGGRVMPSLQDRPEAWHEELNRLHHAGGGVVLSGADGASKWLTENRSAIPESLLTFESTYGQHVQVMDKRRLFEIAAAAGVRTPWMQHVVKRADIDDIAPLVTFPCVLKATLGHVARAAVGFGTTCIGSHSELNDVADELLGHGIDFVLTEMVPGPETALEGSVVVRDHDGNYPLMYGRRKVRQWPADYGMGSMTASAQVPEAHAMHRRLLDHAGYVGVASCEMKRHSGNGLLYLIEINVRLPASFGLGEACGVDAAWRLYSTLAGLPLPPQPPQVDGRKTIFPDTDLQAAWYRIRTKDTTVIDAVRSLGGTRDFGVFAARDPLPGAMRVAEMVRRRSRTVARRLRAWASERHADV